MTLAEARTIVRRLRRAGIDASQRASYTGRGVDQRTTAAVTLARCWDADAAYEAAPQLRSRFRDALGRGAIFY